MVTLALAGLALAQVQAFSLETRYANAFGGDAWGLAHLRAEAAPKLEIGAMAIGGTAVRPMLAAHHLGGGG